MHPDHILSSLSLACVSLTILIALLLIVLSSQPRISKDIVHGAQSLKGGRRSPFVTGETYLFVWVQAQ